MRRRRSFNKKVKFTGLPQDEEEKPEIPPAERIGNKVRFGNTFFEIHQQEDDPSYYAILEILALLFVFVLLYICCYHYETMHYHVAKGYGHLGYASAQHVVGQRLLTGRGIAKNESEAMKWFKYAADQGHPEASFNLAVGHIHGEKTGLRPGQPTKLLKHAKKHGVDGADHALNLCARRGCDV